MSRESIGLTPHELLAFIRACDREPMLVNFTAPLQSE